jgi:hypothetical protein
MATSRLYDAAVHPGRVPFGILRTIVSVCLATCERLRQLKSKAELVHRIY